MRSIFPNRRGRLAVTALAVGLGLFGAANAQPAADTIGTALEAPATTPPAAPSDDEDAAEAVTTAPQQVPAAAPVQPPPTPAPTPPAPAPYSPLPRPPPQAYAPPPASTVTSPIHLEEVGRTPDRPLSPYDMSYDARVRASSASAQGMLGPLDGRWTLNVPGAGDVYVLELVDRGGPLEGAWRDLRRVGALGSSGFVDDIQRFGSTLTVRFTPAEGAGTTVANLTAQADGRWSGELAERGERRPATLRRN